MTFPVLSANTPAATGKLLTRSLRFRSSASAYLNRTPATTSNRRTWTFSAWIKWSVNDNGAFNQGVFGASNSTLSGILIAQSSNTPYQMSVYNCGSQITTTQVFRDPSAWYHIVAVIDTTQATAANRTKLYVNGVQVTAFVTASYPSQNSDTDINTASISNILGNQPGQTSYFDGYLAEVNFVDGQALTPSSFGSTNATTGVWQPAAYTGTYGTNGFYLPFTDNSALTTSSNAGLGKDFSGNANYWVTNNISITAGTTYDSMTDVPTLTSATAANFAVLNPLTGTNSAASYLSEGNLNYYNASNSSNWKTLKSTISIPYGSSKYYWEATVQYTPSGAVGNELGIVQTNANLTSDLGTYYLYWNQANYAIGSTNYSAPTLNDVLQVAYDAVNGQIWFGKNGTWFAGNPSAGSGASFTGITTDMVPAAATYSLVGPTGCIFNFGQRPFSYTPPTGFVALNTYNIAASTVSNGAAYMAATLYTGTGATNNITNTVGSTSFQPDFVWIKGRATSYNNALFDVNRGVNKILITNTTDAEGTETAGSLSAFNSNGFTLASGTATYAATNVSGQTFVAWNWKAGGTAVSNTSGSITSTVSANTTSGFSIIGYTGTGVMSQTIGHGLGVSPNVVIFKNRTTGATDWNTYAPAISVFTRLKLNTTDADLGTYPITVSSTLITLPAINNVAFSSTGNNYIVYAWAAIKGFSAFGSYTGNGSTDGPFVYLGFRPRWIMFKRTDAVADWYLLDTSRDTYNVSSAILYPNLSNAEASSGLYDYLSNGFKLRNAGSAVNASAGTYFYMAFAESPFQNALAR